MPEIPQGDDSLDLSIVLPAFQEEEAIGAVINEIRQAMGDWKGTWEIIVVDDASPDATVERAEAENVQVIRRIQNGGSGAARKTGIRKACGTLVAMLDADGTYAAEDLPRLLEYFPTYDQVNGARNSEQGTYKWLRTPAKWLIRKLAEWISGYQIPDLNTGIKVFKRDLMLRYLWVIPDGFSCVTSMTLAFLCNDHPVRYVDVQYRERVGVSKFHPVRDTFQYVLTIIRIITYFRPLRVFVPSALFVGGLAIVRGTYNVMMSPLGLHDSDIILVMTSIMVLAVGMLAELIVARRR